MELTLEIHDNKRGWLTAARLALTKQNVQLEYDLDYAAEFIGRKDCYALSLAYPVDMKLYQGELPGFILDLVPQGDPLNRLLLRYGIRGRENYLDILAKVPLASPGNIRVREPWANIEAQRKAYKHPGFSLQDITKRREDFVKYMEEVGAPIGGTSGAGGGSPKFLLREDYNGRFHADGWLDDTKTKNAYLMKFPYTDSKNSIALLRTEKIYYDLIRELPVQSGHAIEIHDDILFIKRFDRERKGKSIIYDGLESFYSAHNINVHGADLSHEQNLKLIHECSSVPSDDLIEYLARDIINKVLANTDNHGRNTSFIKKDGDVRLAPIYDVTAMQFFKGDLIVERTRWHDDHQALQEQVAWVQKEFAVPKAKMFAKLGALNKALKGTTERLHTEKIPEDFIEGSEANRRAILSQLSHLCEKAL